MFHNIHSWLHLLWAVLLHFRQLQFIFLPWDVGTLDRVFPMSFLAPNATNSPRLLGRQLSAGAGSPPLPSFAAALLRNQSS